MKRLNYELKALCNHNRDGSYATQSGRRQLLQLMAKQLPELGYPHMGAQSLKPKHVAALVSAWQADNLAVGTIKQRMTALRWWASKVGKPRLMATDNASYGIGARELVAKVSKAHTLDADKLKRISDSYVRLSVQLQQAFGLRREESIKLIPAYADQGDRLCLKASWTKGGKARTVPIRTAAQRQLLDTVKRTVERGGLIPPQRNYIQQVYVYENHTRRAGLHKMHGLRHAYAQQRYLELTGWLCPVCGGPSRQVLSPAQQQKDHAVRLLISKELGHERVEIVAVYLGK